MKSLLLMTAFSVMSFSAIAAPHQPMPIKEDMTPVSVKPVSSKQGKSEMRAEKEQKEKEKKQKNKK